MKVRALRQMWHDLPDEMDVYFVTDRSEEFLVDGTIQVPEYNALYLGETQPGLEEALEELCSVAETCDWQAREDAIDAAERDEEDDDDEVPTGYESSDLPLRDSECCPLPESTQHTEDAVEVM